MSLTRLDTRFMPHKPPTVTQRVEAAKVESRSLDFMESFDPTQLSEWLEVVKDLVAMANSGGGLIVVGVCNKGQPSTADVPVTACQRVASSVDCAAPHSSAFRVPSVRTGVPDGLLVIPARGPACPDHPARGRR